MKIETKFFGTVEIDETEIINFGHGIPGFENYRQFVMLKQNPDSPFLVMQAVESSQPALIVIPLERVVPDYDFDIPDEAVKELSLTAPADAAVYAVVVLPQDISKATVNLAAPIIINTKAKLGKQVILNNPAYGLKHPLFAAPKMEPCEKAKATVK